MGSGAHHARRPEPDRQRRPLQPGRRDIAVLDVDRQTDEQGAPRAVVRIADRGVGIPPGDLPHIFEQFHRGANVVGRVAGTGVGLFSVRQIVEHHGGTVTVDSQEGHGSSFTISLPL